MARENRFSFTMTDTEAEMLEKVALVHRVSKAELIRQFINTQYQLITEDSELHQMVTELEDIAHRTQNLMDRIDTVRKPLSESSGQTDNEQKEVPGQLNLLT